VKIIEVIGITQSLLHFHYLNEVKNLQVLEKCNFSAQRDAYDFYHSNDFDNPRHDEIT
jgi:hypothetical protein